MFKLTYLNYDVNTYKTLVYTNDNKVKKNKEKIDSIYDDLLKQLENYCLQKKTLEKLTPLKDLAKNYDLTKPEKGQPVNNSHTQLYNLFDTNIQLKKEIKKHTVEQLYVKKGLVCPYCGIKRNYTRDLDHYIPRSKYPEFSIMTNNLIFSCPICNQDYKGDLFIDENKNRYILNPYFDDCLDKEILKCKIKNRGIILDIEFYIDSNLKKEDSGAYKVACNHLKKLNLNSRYIDLCEELTDSIIEGFCDPKIRKERRLREFSNQEIQDEIQRDINRLIRTSHPNNFELIFLEELKKCTEWFDELSGNVI